MDCKRFRNTIFVKILSLLIAVSFLFTSLDVVPLFAQTQNNSYLYKLSAPPIWRLLAEFRYAAKYLYKCCLAGKNISLDEINSTLEKFFEKKRTILEKEAWAEDALKYGGLEVMNYGWHGDPALKELEIKFKFKKSDKAFRAVYSGEEFKEVEKISSAVDKRASAPNAISAKNLPMPRVELEELLGKIAELPELKDKLKGSQEDKIAELRKLKMKTNEDEYYYKGGEAPLAVQLEGEFGKLLGLRGDDLPLYYTITLSGELNLGEVYPAKEATDLGRDMDSKRFAGEIPFEGCKTMLFIDGKNYIVVTAVYGDKELYKKEWVVAKGGVRMVDPTRGLKTTRGDIWNAVEKGEKAFIDLDTLGVTNLWGPDMKPNENTNVEDVMQLIDNIGLKAIEDLGLHKKLYPPTTSGPARKGFLSHDEWRVTSISDLESICALLEDEEFLKRAGLTKEGEKTIIIQGFGEVGSNIIRVLWEDQEKYAKYNFKIVGISDLVFGALYNKEGFSLEGLYNFANGLAEARRKETKVNLTDYNLSQYIFQTPEQISKKPNEILFKGAKILIPSAKSYVIQDKRAAKRLEKSGVKIIAPTANAIFGRNKSSPKKVKELEEYIHSLGIYSIPSWLINYGGIGLSKEEIIHRLIEAEKFDGDLKKALAEMAKPEKREWLKRHILGGDIYDIAWVNMFWALHLWKKEDYKRSLSEIMKERVYRILEEYKKYLLEYGEAPDDLLKKLLIKETAITTAKSRLLVEDLEDDIGEFIEALSKKDKPMEIRRVAAYVLGRSGNKAYIDGLLKIIKDNAETGIMWRNASTGLGYLLGELEGKYKSEALAKVIPSLQNIWEELGDVKPEEWDKYERKIWIEWILKRTGYLVEEDGKKALVTFAAGSASGRAPYMDAGDLNRLKKKLEELKTNYERSSKAGFHFPTEGTSDTIRELEELIKQLESEGPVATFAPLKMANPINLSDLHILPGYEGIAFEFKSTYLDINLISLSPLGNQLPYQIRKERRQVHTLLQYSLSLLKDTRARYQKDVNLYSAGKAFSYYWQETHIKLNGRKLQNLVVSDLYDDINEVGAVSGRHSKGIIWDEKFLVRLASIFDEEHDADIRGGIIQMVAERLLHELLEDENPQGKTFSERVDNEFRAAKTDSSFLALRGALSKEFPNNETFKQKNVDKFLKKYGEFLRFRSGYYYKLLRDLPKNLDALRGYIVNNIPHTAGDVSYFAHLAGGADRGSAKNIVSLQKALAENFEKGNFDYNYHLYGKFAQENFEAFRQIFIKELDKFIEDKNLAIASKKKYDAATRELRFAKGLSSEGPGGMLPRGDERDVHKWWREAGFTEEEIYDLGEEWDETWREAGNTKKFRETKGFKEVEKALKEHNITIKKLDELSSNENPLFVSYQSLIKNTEHRFMSDEPNPFTEAEGALLTDMDKTKLINSRKEYLNDPRFEHLLSPTHLYAKLHDKLSRSHTQPSSETESRTVINKDNADQFIEMMQTKLENVESELIQKNVWIIMKGKFELEYLGNDAATEKYKRMIQRLRTIEKNEGNVTFVEDKVSMVNVMKKKIFADHKVVVIDDNPEESISDQDLSGLEEYKNQYAIIQAEIRRKLERDEFQYFNIKAMVALGLAIMDKDRDEDRIKEFYNLLTGEDIMDDKLKDIKASNIVRLLPRIVKFSGELDTYTIIRKLVDIAA